jgi:Transposase DDE domain
MRKFNALVPLRLSTSVRRQLSNQSELPFAEHFPEGRIHGLCRNRNRSFRDRIFTPAITLWTFLSQVLDPDHSCRQAVARLLAYRTARGLKPCSPDTGAYCRARGRLPESLLQELTRSTGRQLPEQAAWLWKGRSVKVVDGTGLSMPDTPKNNVAFPKSKIFPPGPGVGFPMMRLVVLFSLAVGTVLEAAMGPAKGKGSGELSLFRQFRKRLQRGDVLLGDRMYATYWDVAWALAHGVDVVLRQNACRVPVSFRGYNANNRRVCWFKPTQPGWMGRHEYQRMPRLLRLRAVRVLVPRIGFRTRRLVLITTLMDAQEVTGADLGDLYRRRWQAELNLRSLKQTLQMDILRGQTPDVVHKEVWAHLLVYNVVRIVMAQAAQAESLQPEQLSFKGALQTINSFLPNMRSAKTLAEKQVVWEVVLWAVSQHRVANRSNRFEPRAVKRRPKPFPHLRIPRDEARKRMLRKANAVTTRG